MNQTSNGTIQIYGQPLTYNAGDTSYMLNLMNFNGNYNQLSVFQLRTPIPPGWPANFNTGWYTATTRIQNFVNNSPQGYIDFNPYFGPNAIAFGSAGGEFMRIADGGHVGIGTISPQSSLEVNGDIRITANSGHSLIFPDGSVQSSASPVTSSNGVVQLTNGTAGVNIALSSQLITGTFGGGGGNLNLQANDLSMGSDTGGFISLAGSHRGDATNRVNISAGRNVPNVGLTVDALNRVGIGVPSYAATLTQALNVVGNVQISGTGASILFPDNTVQSTAWNGTLCGGDYAESVDVGPERKSYEPGDVIVIDPEHDGSFKRSTSAYSKLVAGVYSTKPGLTGRRQPASQSKEDEIPMAMVGIVPTKVSTINGPIEPGDLLVTSSIPGVAMRASDDALRPGVAIGKAMKPLKTGSGLIEVLVSLQ